MTSFFEFFQNNGNLVILNLILQITLLSGIAIILAYRYKNNAAARYGILFPALISLLLLTATSLFLQSRNTSLFYLPVEIEQTSLSAAAPGFIFNELAIPGIELESVSTEPADLGVAQGSIAVEKKSNAAWELLLGLPSYLILMGIWIGGFLILTMGLLRSFHNIEQVSRSSSQLSLAERQRLDKLLVKVLSKKAGISFRASDQISSPMLTGLISPVILLPENFISNLNERQLKSVLLHELAHFERKDLLANFSQKVLLTIFWFHPLVHVMDRMISRAREEICDNYVLAKELPLDYSEALLHVSTLTSRFEVEPGGRNLAVGMFGSEWKLEQRIGELLNEGRERSMKLSRRTGRALQSFLIVISLLLASCQLGVAENREATGNADVQSVLVQDVVSSQLEARQQLKGKSIRLRDLGEQLQQQKGSLADQASVTVEQISLLELDTRELVELEIRAMADEKEKVLRRQQQLKRELIGPSSAGSMEELLYSLEAISALLQQEGDNKHREDVARLTRRLLNNLLRQNTNTDDPVVFEQQIIRSAEDILRYLNGDSLDKYTLIGALDALAAQASVQLAQQGNAAVYIQTQTPAQPQPQAQSQSLTQSRTARTAGVLGPRIMRAISEIQEYMQPADSDTEVDMDAAKELLDRLYSERFERMNDFEKSTTLSFYTNYYLGTENYPEAIRSFEQALTIDTLRDDIRLRTLRSLGQLYAAVENWEESIQNYQLWREVSPQEDELTFRGLSYAHYQLEQFNDALPNWLSYMELVKDNDGELVRDDYAYLNGLYFTLKDFDSALELTKEMILLFNDPVDWTNLREIFKTLDTQRAASQTEELIGALKGNGIEPQISQAEVVPTDGDYLPSVAIPPRYPTRAAQRGVEGWVLLAFTVDEEGNVVEDTVGVIDADPPTVFNRSAIRAATRFKYEPRVRNGKAVVVPGVQYLFRYELNENA